jgi:NADP-dependent 3-hydroxy acid dehydrogenase YdfG
VFVQYFAILANSFLIVSQSISPGVVTTEIFEAAGIPKEEMEMFEGVPSLAASDIADSVIYVLGTPPHVQVS